MVDSDLILAKAGSVRSHLNRVFEKRDVDLKIFLNDLTRKMVTAIGFRNLIVHEYGKMELEQVYEIAQNDINDLNDYLKSIFEKLGLADD